MSTVSTHVLDLGSGEPATGLGVSLATWIDEDWRPLRETVTDGGGRADLGEAEPGRHRMAFETGAWGNAFYPFVHVVFVVNESERHYHIPLLLSPYGYSTYRGG